VAEVEVEELRVRYGTRVAVDGASFVARAGEVLAILGPNGAGKTSTVETLEGYRAPDGGRVRVLGRDPWRERRAVVPSLGVMLQDGGTYPMLSPRRALRLFAAYYDDPLDPDELVERTGLGNVADTAAKRLSGGERRRLSLALALVGRPRILMLDEPTAGIDPGGRLLVRELVRERRDDGVCVLLTSHELDEVERLADRIVILDRGRVVAEGSPAELRRRRPILRFRASPGIAVDELGERLGCAVRETSPGDYEAAAAPDATLLSALGSWLAERGLALTDVSGGEERLEDVFLRLVGSEDGSGAGQRGDRAQAPSRR
jgi:ABC-2 type transport system ATP-binding protein